jgi:hypothetical protein
VFRLARATYDRLPERQPTWAFDTCAVVGNSGALLHRRLGRTIDAHDAVLRINNAPLIGFVPHVGAKTTFSLVNQVCTGVAPACSCVCEASARGCDDEGGGRGGRTKILPRVKDDDTGLGQGSGLELKIPGAGIGSEG